MSRERELLLQAWEELLDAYEGSNGERVAKEIQAYLTDTNPSETINNPEVDRSKRDEEPFGYVSEHTTGGYYFHRKHSEIYWDTCVAFHKVYLHPASRKPFVRLSEEEIADVLNVDPMWFHLPDLNWNSGSLLEYARAIEDALEEKNK